MKIRHLFMIALAVLTSPLTSVNASGQTASTWVFASGLRTPVKTIITPKGNLLVAEAGNGLTPAESRSSIRAEIDARLSTDCLRAFAPPNLDPSGPSALAPRGRTLFVVIGAGDGTLRGPVPATEMINPNPSSPFVSSVLRFRQSTGRRHDPGLHA